jgi:hypothetical protein
MSKYVLVGKASLKNLVFGLVSLFLATGLILFLYGYISGMGSSGQQFIITYDALRSIVIVMFGILFLGFGGGYEIGKYVYETMYGEKRSEKPPS